MNQVVLVGNLTEDPALRYTQSGKAVANFTLAVSHRSRHNGQWQDVTDGFFTVTCWDTLADNVAGSLKKGSRALVAGKLIQRTFETEGVKRTVVEIQAQHVGPDLQFVTATIQKASRRLRKDLHFWQREPGSAGLFHLAFRVFAPRPNHRDVQREIHQRGILFPALQT